MKAIRAFYEHHILSQRHRVVSDHVANLIPPRARVLDVGCGDGLVTSLIAQRRRDIDLQGVDVLVPPSTHFPVREYDGHTIPYRDRSFDAVLCVDMLHHTEDPLAFLREVARVSGSVIIIKDHTADGLLAVPILRLMDRWGNAGRGVSLPYTYWPKSRWLEAFDRLGVSLETWIGHLGIYPPPASWICERSLHFIARLRVSPMPHGR